MHVLKCIAWNDLCEKMFRIWALFSSLRGEVAAICRAAHMSSDGSVVG